MGLRTLIEINHDTSANLVKCDPTAFAAAFEAYVQAGSQHHVQALSSQFDFRVVALRHSNDCYYIGTTFGFPSKLPWDDFEVERTRALAAAKNLTGGNRRSKQGLEDIIARLVAIVERQQEILDAD
jgi:hypothetical protein